ncbi:MAG: hypothetical protein KatS3mg015_2990 [Fimbriimonadales bacterium]|nr:MAG: hypothetical protein KatS3mg015_2990 [Fimbriimonadales bacterium]
MPKIKRLEIKGFRAFGRQLQVLEFRGPMAIIWGPNSQGKTSLAEAIEFLLTGKTARRELVASAKREFAEALRNAHLPDDEPVIVSADIEDAAGRVRRVERRLLRDYTGRDPCQSELTIDGGAAADLTPVGIRLSQPPLEAPVLMPHTLRYVVSADPQERTEYFKALLEVSDLEEIRDAISGAKNQLAEPTRPTGTLYDRCRANTHFGGALSWLGTAFPSREAVEAALSQALERALSVAGKAAPEGLDARLSELKTLLEQRRSATFPVHEVEARSEPSWGPQPEVREPLDDFLRAKAAVDAEVSRFLRLFEEVLKVPEVASATAPLDCPVCETPKALSLERIQAIRRTVDANAAFGTSRERAAQALREIRGLPMKIINEADRACARCVKWSPEERVEKEAAIKGLVGDRADELIPKWDGATSRTREAISALKGVADGLLDVVASTGLDGLDEATVEALRSKTEALFARANEFGDAIGGYREAAKPLIEELTKEIDRRVGTEGWQDLIDLTEQREELLSWLIKKAAYKEMVREVEEAVRQIDEAKAEILDEKFAQLGQEILRWWNLLRPDEPTSFHGLGRGGTGRRFLDLKARLSVPGAASGVIRDAVAVFSDSQLNCLGLAAFLARTVRESAGFVVLDDPVPASDEEHRAFFIDRVLQELVNSSIQVIVLTHDERMWKDVQERYSHLDLDTFVVTMEDPRGGATVENRSDTLDALLARASPFIESPNPEIRKIGAGRLRDAAERFCKLVLVQERQRQGDASARVSDYEGKTLGDLVPQVQPLLHKDASHAGKLRLIGQRLNPGSHDHRVPPPGDLKQCLGDLKYLRKEYLP